jgi:hypothetical protein
MLLAMPPALEDAQLHWWRTYFSFEVRMSPVLKRRFGGVDSGWGEGESLAESGCLSVFGLDLLLDMV